jgi:hypothetical protein
MANTQLKLRQLIQDGAALDNVIKWDGSKWVAGAVPSLDGNQVFIEGFAGSSVDLDANDGTVKNAAGTNVAFTLPSNLDSLFVYKNGIRLDRDGSVTRDYSLNAGTNTITFNVALTTADAVTIWKGTVGTGGSGTGTDLSYTASTRLLASSTGSDVTLPLFSTTDAGLAPASGGGSTNFLRADGTWAAPAGGGDVVGPASSVNNRVVFFDGTTGKLIKDSGLTLSGTNTGDQTTIVGITGTKAQFDTAVTDGNFMYVGDAPTAHTLDSHSNVTITANSDGEILRWNGSAWINNTLAEAGIQPAGSYLTANQTITLSGDVTGSGSTAITATIANDAVTYAKLQNVAANSFLANVTGVAANAQEIATSRIPLFASAITGTPSSTTYLRGDGTWATPSGGSGDIVNGGQNGTVTIGTNDANPINLETNGTNRFTIGTTGLATLTSDTATTGAVVESLTVQTNSTGTPSAGFGGRILFLGESSTTTNREMGGIGSVWIVATDASRYSATHLYALDSTQLGGSVGRFYANSAPMLEIPSSIGNYSVNTKYKASSIEASVGMLITSGSGGITMQTTHSDGVSILSNANSSSGSINLYPSTSAFTFTSGTKQLIRVSSGHTLSSGTGAFDVFTIDHAINQTGTATGNYRGFIVNPTLTSLLGTYTGLDLVTNSSSFIGINQQGANSTNRIVGSTTFGSSATPHASALLDIVSTTKGLGLPAMTTTQVNAISSPRDGLVVYDTDTDTLKVRANGAWTSLGSGGATNLAYTGTLDTITLTSDTGTDVIFQAGTNMSLSVSGDTMVISTTNTGDVEGQASSVDSEIALFAGTTGKVIKRATGTGIVNVSSGVYQTPITIPSGNLVGTTATQTLTNKRIDPRVSSINSSSTPTPNADTDDMYIITGLAAGATFGAPTGTPVQGQRLVIRVKDNGTARTLGYNAIYRAMGVVLPTTTVANKTLYLGMIYNFTDTKWDVVAVSQEA